MQIERLDYGWELEIEPQRAIPAAVPGSVHGALMAAGLLADPFIDLNELRQDWVGRRDWIYCCDFDWHGVADATTDIVFDGIDTFAELQLNGVQLGQTANMHRSYRFDVTALLRPGRNQLQVAIRSAYAAGVEVAKTLEPRPSNYPGPGNVIRKMACSFGWDWGPTLASAGLWRPVRLEIWRGARLGQVRPMVTLEGRRGVVRAAVEVVRQAEEAGPLSLRMSIASHSVAAAVEVAVDGDVAECSIEVADPAVWWPHDLGDPALHDLQLELRDAQGDVLDRWTKKVGFRSVRLHSEPDAEGTSFALVVNEVPIYVRGANWIPDDALPERVTRARYRERVQQARDANIDLLRVWGGGIYESADFYEICDELGMLVWQDFLFACAAYPEEGSLPGEIEAEARENVVRLMPHPSLVLWNGNNENIWMWADAGWQAVLGERSWGLGYYLELLPRIVGELDPTRPYWPGSPYSGSMALAPNDPAHGCTHIWDVWNEVGYEAYRNSVPRFCSEFGWQAPPTYATLAESVSERPLTIGSAAIVHHQKATDGNGKLQRGLAGHLPQPSDIDGWIYLNQLNQARAVTTAIEHMRSHRGANMGAIVWQLNDCWPSISWSAIDSGGRQKLLWYALRRSYAPHLLTIQPRGTKLHIFAVNERTLFWRSPVTVRRVRFDGTVLAEWRHWRLCVDRFSVESLDLPDSIAQPSDPGHEMLVANMLDATATWFFREDVALALQPPDYRLTVRRDGEDSIATVTANVFLRSLCIMADRLAPDARVDQTMVDLLPGASHDFRLTGAGNVTADDLRATRAIRTVNDHVGPHAA